MIQVEVSRGQFIESRHSVVAVVVDENGRQVKSFGDPALSTSPRSAIKMLQAIPLVASGAADFYKLSSQHICLACASHNGEENHILLAENWMALIKAEENWFRCGAHWPSDEEAMHQWIKAGQSPTPKVNNCSGKHLGMMTTALYNKEEPQDYYKYEHPRQVELRKILSEVTQCDHEKAQWGIDGCGIPTYSIPLFNMAVGMSYLLKPNKASGDLQSACKKIIDSVKEHPFYIGGSDDFVSKTIENTNGRCLIKVGAEGVYCGVLPEKGLAFALKALDGSFRAADAATVWLLQNLGEAKAFSDNEIRNWAGEKVGEIRIRLQ
jgi:L-asparaginase II